MIIKVNRLKEMSFRPFFKPDSDRVVDVSFFLKLSAFALDAVCLSLWLTAPDAPDAPDVPDQLVPSDNSLELTLCYLTVPGHVVVLGGLVWLYLLGEPPRVHTQRVFLAVGLSLFIANGTFAVINYFRNTHDVTMLITGLLCVGVGVILLVDFLLNERFFTTAGPVAREVDASQP